MNKNRFIELIDTHLHAIHAKYRLSENEIIIKTKELLLVCGFGAKKKCKEKKQKSIFKSIHYFWMNVQLASCCWCCCCCVYCLQFVVHIQSVLPAVGCESDDGRIELPWLHWIHFSSHSRMDVQMLALARSIPNLANRVYIMRPFSLHVNPLEYDAKNDTSY